MQKNNKKPPPKWFCNCVRFSLLCGPSKGFEVPQLIAVQKMADGCWQKEMCWLISAMPQHVQQHLHLLTMALSVGGRLSLSLSHTRRSIRGSVVPTFPLILPFHLHLCGFPLYPFSLHFLIPPPPTRLFGRGACPAWLVFGFFIACITST